ncbi:hypothetical protein D3C81_10210 [compost metagenome]
MSSIDIRIISKEIIKAYVFFIRDKVKQLDSRYINLGIDANFDDYEKLFYVVLRSGLRLPSKEGDDKYSMDIIDECISVIERTIIRHNYSEVISAYKDIVYETCLLAFRKVEEGLRENGKV